MTPVAARELRARVVRALADPRTVAARLGLEGRPQSGGGITVPCVWHSERTPSLSLFLAKDGTLGAKCHGCGRGGGVLDVMAAVLGYTLPRDTSEVIRQAATLAGEDLRVETILPDRPPPAEPPPVEEVRLVLEQSVRPEVVTVAARWLRSRGLDPVACAPLCRVITVGWPRWARSAKGPWVSGPFRLLLPVYDARGALRSVRARRIDDARPKEIPPLGCRASGYVFSNRVAVEMLRREADEGPACVLITEGTPDYLTWATRLRGAPWAVLGLPGSGAWSPFLADRIPDGSEVVIRTDPDDAGDRYAGMIAGALGERCRVLVTDAGGRAARRAACAVAQREDRPPCSGSRGRDDNELLMAGELPMDPHDGASPL